MQLCKQVASLVAVKLVLLRGNKYLQVMHIDDHLILLIFFLWFCYLFVLGVAHLTSFTQKELESLQGKRIKLDVARCCPSNIRLSCWVVWSLLYSMICFFIYCKFGNQHLPCSGMKTGLSLIRWCMVDKIYSPGNCDDFVNTNVGGSKMTWHFWCQYFLWLMGLINKMLYCALIEENVYEICYMMHSHRSKSSLDGRLP